MEAPGSLSDQAFGGFFFTANRWLFSSSLFFHLWKQAKGPSECRRAKR
jgi:hypothetical protein